MHIGASAAKILYDLTKRSYSELSKQTARDRGKYQVVPGGVKIPLDAKE